MYSDALSVFEGLSFVDVCEITCIGTASVRRGTYYGACRGKYQEHVKHCSDQHLVGVTRQTLTGICPMCTFLRK